ncbi:hypothetical protein JOY44_03060 [Phormidium sp. CLA17]|uniref:hypothetical protein n=1 Tax=Leptolyngbya sp. Cla-17 TaxID=2803751 RepID=UPI0014922F6D|nr:hypothetical protein [Leptolyngbya sp. Cla-17]MBM0740605.1 hypothetical protein [Leptolyngbya sp. Cla-17]
MKGLKRYLMMPMGIALALLGSAETAFSESITVTPNSPSIQMNGTSGGNQKDGGCAGFIAAVPNHVVQVTEDTDLRFILQGNGEPALLIRSSSGQNFCVPADSYSNGKVEIPGRWRRGTYSVYVGDRANGQHSYTLQVARN